MPKDLTEQDWTSLMRRIRDGKCTPFLGAGASHPPLPLGSTVAETWADKHDYPLEDRDNLLRVAEYLAVKNDPLYPKEEFLEKYLRKVKPPDFTQPDDPHGLLAKLPLPIYITTNYDDFMVRALRARGKSPHRELLPWNKYISEYESVFDAESDFSPDADDPVVFHLHGHNEVTESLVLTERDYLDFLVNVSRDPSLIPARIQRALAATSLLFIGYSLSDWTFRVVFQGILQSIDSSQRRLSITVQLPPEKPVTAAKKEAQEYRSIYFEKQDIRVFWGTARQFATELRERWEVFSNA